LCASSRSIFACSCDIITNKPLISRQCNYHHSWVEWYGLTLLCDGCLNRILTISFFEQFGHYCATNFLTSQVRLAASWGRLVHREVGRRTKDDRWMMKDEGGCLFDGLVGGKRSIDVGCKIIKIEAKMLSESIMLFLILLILVNTNSHGHEAQLHSSLRYGFHLGGRSFHLSANMPVESVWLIVLRSMWNTSCLCKCIPMHFI
jgi:hypothetical protein